jgi:hypothetical protein
VLLAGLQGSGKTTSAGKLARFLTNTTKKKVLMVSTDVYRPAAIDQLERLSGPAGAAFWRASDGTSPADIARLALEQGRTRGFDFLVFDTAGRLHIDDPLMAELDAIKRDRIGGLMLCRDWGERGPWPTWPKPDDPDFTHMSRKVKEIIRAAGMRDELSFTSFRHGGFTEGGDAELTDREMLAQGRHTTVKVLPKYTKRTTRQVMNGAKKRRASRETKTET